MDRPHDRPAPHDPPTISSARRPDAEQQIEWTGERMVPWIEDPALAYEHLHRYALAAELADGRRVLDIGSGEGYGAALLASRAIRVRGVDIDPAAVRHSTAAYASDNLTFAVGSAEDLSEYRDDSFDLVVCYEVIEHLSAQERLVSEVSRILTPDGLFVCSTPNREPYRALTGEHNPFHVRELDGREFDLLLTSRFAHICLWGQRTFTGSVIHPLERRCSGTADAVFIKYDEHRWDLVAEPEPIYFVAIASNAPLSPGRSQSVLVDPDQLLAVRERRRAARVEQELHEARLERAETEERLQGYMRAVERRENEVRELVGVADGLRDALASAHADLARLEAQQAAIESSASWQILQRLRRLTRRADGTHNMVGRAISRLLSPLATGSSHRR